MSEKMKGNLILLLTAAVWGSGFISQKLGNQFMSPMLFNGFRQLLAVPVLMPIAIMGLRRSGYLSTEVNDAETVAARKKKALIAGLICGGLFLLGSMTQQLGLVTVSAGKSGFISALYIVIVPIFALVIGEKIRLKSVICVVIAVVGFAVMSLQGGLGKATAGDWLTLTCAAGFAAQIVAVNYFVDDDNAVLISVVQMFVAGAIGLIIAFQFETFTWEAFRLCLPVLAYQIIFPTAMGYTLQIVGQRYAEPTTAALLMSTEAIFAAILGALILKEAMSAKEILGAAIIFSAIILGQLEPKTDKAVPDDEGTGD